MADHSSSGDTFEQIAVIGLAARYPDAPDVGQFWNNLRNGVHSLQRFSDDILGDLGIPSEIYEDPNFVRMGTMVPDAECFDASFFGFTPREAAGLDPQARVFLESCHSALEHAGYDPQRYDGAIGVFAGSNPHDYAVLLGRSDRHDTAGAMDRLIGTDKDFIATRVSHRLNLRGPALNIQTACSTSLVCVHVACQSLLNYDSDIALAGGVGLNFRQGIGYFYQEGVILSPDGFCRAFDEDANGTTLGQGCGVVALKRLSEALDDNDTIHAIIKATALNNDGSDKINYTAPSELGQADVISAAQSLAGVTADDITFVETHGTGTSLGDPIEVAGLSRAFSRTTERRGYCALGAVKTNIGHTDAAAGITGLIKTVLSLEHAEIPPTLHFKKPNPNIDFASTPFYVNADLQPWETDGRPRRAGVSSFGIGGTNAHVILEEAPARQQSDKGRAWQLITLSAKSKEALKETEALLAAHLEEEPETSVADLAYTLNIGRGHFEHRSVVIADSAAETAAALRGGGAARKLSAGPVKKRAKVVFTFPGGGAQYPQMARDIYDAEPVFRDEVDRCAQILEPHLGFDLRTLLFPPADREGEAASKLATIALSMPALVTIEYSLARLIISWGIQPDAFLGHSTGQYAAAILADVFSLEDGLGLVATRGKLMESTKPGTMLAVSASVDDIHHLLDDDVDLAVINGPQSCVFSGERGPIDALAARLEAEEIEAQRLRLTHASHCRLMEPIMETYEAEVRAVRRQPQKIPMLSDSNGRWLTEDEATDPSYWAAHLRRTVHFGDCIDELLESERWTFLEVGPGKALSTFVRQSKLWTPEVKAVTTVRHPKEERSDTAVILEAVGKLWLDGASPDWNSLYSDQNRHRIPLPTYPFQRERYWAPEAKNLFAVDPSNLSDGKVRPPTKKLPLDDWYYLPSWRRGSPAAPTATQSWLVFAQPNHLSEQVLQALKESEAPVWIVRPASEFDRVGPNTYTINPEDEDDYGLLVAALSDENALPDAVIHMWAADPDASACMTEQELSLSLDLGVHSVLSLTRALGRQDATRPVRLEIVTTHSQSVTGTEPIRPEAAAMLGPCKVIPLEYANMTCRSIDLPGGADAVDSVPQLISEISSVAHDPIVALRGRYRWRYCVEPVHVAPPGPDDLPLKKGGVYLLIGGLGGVGLSIAVYLAEKYQAKLALQGRSGRPDPALAETDPEIAGRIEALARVEAAAGDVVVIQADMLDESAMQAAVRKAEDSLGSIDGVIVTAAVLDNAGAIHTLSREELNRVVGTKTYGSLILHRIFADRSLDFVLFSSSIATALYHNRFGQVGYVTANSFVEAFSLRDDWNDTRVVTVAWDDWLQYGMSVRAANDFAKRETFGDITLMDPIHSFSPDEGMVVFERCLLGGYPQVYISTTDLTVRMQLDVDVGSPFLEQALSQDGGDTELLQAGDGNGYKGVLISIWRDLLGYETFDDDADFFDLGGDSLQVARMADRLSRALGLPIPINLIFEASTIGQLDQRLKDLQAAGGASIVADQGLVTGTFPLSPAQSRFLSRGSANPNHWNVSVLLEPTEKLQADLIRQAMAALMQHHDALRLRIRKDGSSWLQESVEPAWDDTIFKVIDLADLPADTQSNRVDEIASEMQAGLNLSDGPVVQIVLFELGGGKQRLFIVVHHLMSDRVSLLQMLEDFQLFYTQLAAGHDLKFPQKTTSFKQWVESFSEYAQSAEADLDLKRWLSLAWSKRKSIPCDTVDGGPERNTNASATEVCRKLHWRNGLPVAKGGDVKLDEAALASLGQAVGEWSKSSSMAIDVVGHGRRVFEAPTDVSRTLGFFFTFGTVLLDLAGDRGSVEPREIVDQIRAIGPRAWTLDAIRYMRLAGQDEAALPSKSEVLFNYVGRPIATNDGALFNPVDERQGSGHDPSGLRDHLLAVLVELDGDSDLNIKFVFSENIHHAETIEYLAELFIGNFKKYFPSDEPAAIH